MAIPVLCPPNLFLIACITIHAENLPYNAIKYVESIYRKEKVRFDRTETNQAPNLSSDPYLLSSKHAVWGKDPRTGLIEGLVLLSPIKNGNRGFLVWVKEGPNRSWIHRLVCTVEFTPESTWRVWALPANILAEYQSKKTFLPDQDPSIPEAPIEFHLDDSEEGLSNPAQIFHPTFGLACVAHSIQDDRQNPSPRGQYWSTHARGESIVLPASAFNRFGVISRQSGRVWFRLDNKLFVADQSDWDSWFKSYSSVNER